MLVFSILARTKRFCNHVVGCVWHSRGNTDKYFRIGEDTTLECVHMAVKVIIHLFGLTYLHAPNERGQKEIDIDERKKRLARHAW
jgi:hypothetical protein